MRISPVGLTVDSLDTPALLLDLEAFRHNVATMADTILAQNRLQWRPHAKAFKTPAIAWELLRAGAIGVTVAKVSEAEVMAAAGIPEILIAHLVVGPAKCARAAAIARGVGLGVGMGMDVSMSMGMGMEQSDTNLSASSVSAREFRLTVTVDHPAQVTPLGAAARTVGATLGVLVDVNVGMNRGGAAGPREAVALMNLVRQTPGLAFRGLMGYEGHTLLLPHLELKRAAIAQAMDHLATVRNACEEAGAPCEVVSVGGTGSYQITATLGATGITELQAGGGVFACQYYRQACRVTGHQPALTVLTTIVGQPTPQRWILNAGKKTLSDHGAPPVVLGLPQATVVSLSAEHAIVTIPSNSNSNTDSDTDSNTDPAYAKTIGDPLELIPGYSDLTFVLHDRVLAHQQRRILADWPLLGRGMLQ